MLLLMTTTDTATKTKFTLTPLPYEYTALEPEISEETLRYHHDKHLAGYVAKLNELVPGTPYENMQLEAIIRNSDGAIFNNAAQIWNHDFYFEALSPRPQHQPEGALLKAINEQFGSFETLKEKITTAAMSIFGSGYVWLVEDKAGKLSIYRAQNADNPLKYGWRPLLCIDVWEHAYYIDYRNRRADSIAALWSIVDWRKVAERYMRQE